MDALEDKLLLHAFHGKHALVSGVRVRVSVRVHVPRRISAIHLIKWLWSFLARASYRNMFIALSMSPIRLRMYCWSLLKLTSPANLDEHELTLSSCW